MAQSVRVQCINKTNRTSPHERIHNRRAQPGRNPLEDA